MADRQTYKVIATREPRTSKWWELKFPDFGPDAVSQANGIMTINAEARDYIAVTLNVDKWSFDVEVVMS